MLELSVSPESLDEGLSIFRYRQNVEYLEYTNSALNNLLGYNFDQMKGCDFSAFASFVNDEDLPALTKMVDSLPEKKKGSCTIHVKSSEGHIKYLTVRARHATDEQGPQAIFVFEDVTQHMETIAREQIMVKCLRMITSDNGRWRENITEVIADVQNQYQADRCYIFEFDWSVDQMSNVYETVAEGVRPEIDSLQNMPVELIGYWLDPIKQGHAIFIDDLSALKDDPSRKMEYDVLAPQDIVCLMVVPIIRHGNLYGYIGVDNPAVHKGDKDFLTSIAQILSQEYYSREQQEKLLILSLTDPLTKVSNRHAYNKKLEEVTSCTSDGVGVVFIDVNGLKYNNDRFGHDEGDRLINRSAEVLLQYFDASRVFRISGDEFVCIVEDVDEASFKAWVSRIRCDAATDNGEMFAVGYIWTAPCENLSVAQMVADAEKMMYQDKERFYLSCPRLNRRKSDRVSS